jgi:3',5'-cyclic AMP phosphodiesterase CpdA
MRKILHLSDLHFGRTDPAVVTAVREIAHRLDPHLIAVSGDLTQRAREHQFKAARAFLDSLSAPTLVVPGNHDVPLYNVAARFLRPLRRYDKYISDDVQPVFVDDEIAVVGIRTARSLTWKGGRINRAQAERAREIFCGVAQKQVRILVTHHPFDLPQQFKASSLAGRAAMAMAWWGECAPDLLLAGHLHLHGAGTTVRPTQRTAAIVVQAGTATSTRVRGERNSFNLIHVSSAAVDVHRYGLTADGNSFAPESTTHFVRTAAGWRVTDIASA